MKMHSISEASADIDLHKTSTCACTLIAACTARAADCTLLLSEHRITYCLDQIAQIDETFSQASLHTKVSIGLAGRVSQVEVAV